MSETITKVWNTCGYVRLSREDGDKEESNSVTGQKDLIRNFLHHHPELQECGMKVDDGYTGSNFNRPAFQEMLADVKAGKFNCIVVKDLSRLGREYLDAGEYIERIFPFLDVRFIAVNDSLDTLTAERSQDGYIVPLKNIMNDVYSKDISRKILPALTTKRQNGEFIGTWAAYGYQKCPDDRHRIEPDAETAPVVREMFQWRLSGLSYQSIARKLNERSIPSPARYHYLKGDAKSERYANTLWSVYAVKKILTNEVYLGHMIQGRKRSGFSEGRKPYSAPESEWMIVRNTHEPLVDEETFRTVQRMAAEASSAYKERLGRHDGLGTIPHILRGLIYCADCKRPLVRYKSVTNKGRNLYYVYICPSHTAELSSCPKKYFHETALIEILWDTLRREIALAVNLDKLVRQYSKSAKAISQEASLKREIASAKQALSRAEMLYDSLFQNYADKLMSEREYTEMKRQYRSDMEQAQARLHELEQQQDVERRKAAENPWLTACAQFKEEQALTEAMAHALIERVEIDAGNHIKIALRYRDEYNALVQLLAAEGKAVSA